MSTLRITLTKEIEQILDLLQIRYPTLSKVEITKLALGEFQKDITKAKTGSLFEFYQNYTPKKHLSDEEAMQISIEAVNEVRKERSNS